MASNLFNKFSIFKKQESTDIKLIKDEGHKKFAEIELNEILSEQCVLCGDYMVDSIQCSVCKPKKFKPGLDGNRIRLDDKKEWDLIDSI